MDEIYVDYQAVRGLAERLRDYGENIQSTCRKMNDYLAEVNNQWRGSKSTKFTNRMQDYIGELLKKGNYYIESADKLIACSNTYQEIDQYFSRQEI